jgi:hypothetical protein
LRETVVSFSGVFNSILVTVVLSLQTSLTDFYPYSGENVDQQENDHQHEGGCPGLLDAFRVGLLRIFPQGQRQGIHGLVDDATDDLKESLPLCNTAGDDLADVISFIPQRSKQQRSLADWNIQPSMSRVGNCYDNAVAESFFGTLKAECVTHQFATHAQARTTTFEYIEVWYNRQRLHSSLGYLSPVEFEHQHGH